MDESSRDERWSQRGTAIELPTTNAVVSSFFGRFRAALSVIAVTTDSILAYAEFLFLVEKYDIDRVRAVSNLLDMVPVVPEEHAQAILKGVQQQEDLGMTNLDSLHAGLAETWGTSILGSETDYDDLDVDRVPLEPDRDE